MADTRISDLAAATPNTAASIPGVETPGVGPVKIPMTAAGATLLEAANAAAQRTALGLAAVAASGSASDLSTGNLPAARIGQYRGVADAADAPTNADKVVLFTSISAPRTVTLPAANTMTPGQFLVIGDVSGSVSATNSITIARAGADTIDGATSEVINAAYGSRTIYSDGISKWFFDGGIARASNTMTFTNKRITPRVGTVASSATPTINTDTTDYFTITALAVAITSMTTNLSGTPTTGQTLRIRILDNGTARAITWGASFVSRGATLPTTTVLGKRLLVGFDWDEVAAAWACVAVAQEV